MVALHVESLVPATYNRLMQPLRFERFSAKFRPMLETFPGKVLVSVPVSRLNREELPEIRRWFLENGAAEVVFDPLSSRCAEDRTLFDSLSLAPVPIRCGTDVLDDLIVDCDGRVLICCQDFARTEPIGDLTRASLRDVLTNLGRRTAQRRFRDGQHEEYATCSRCYGDVRGTVERELASA